MADMEETQTPETAPEPCAHPADSITWNPVAKIVQCHECGHVIFDPTAQLQLTFAPAYYFPKPVDVDATQELALRGKWASKMAKVYELIERVAERGVNKSQGYKYVTAEDLYDAARKAMATAGLVIVPLMHLYTVQGVATTSNGADMRYIETPFTFLIIDTETGFSMPIPWMGEASDTGDKALAKTVTSAIKYFVRSVFLISTGEDADATAPDAPPPPKRGAAARTDPPAVAAGPPERTIVDPAHPDAADANQLRAVLDDRQSTGLADMCKNRGLDYAGVLAAAWRGDARDNDGLVKFITENKDTLPKVAKTTATK